MPDVTLTRVYRFASAHRLHSPHLSAAENARVYGKCNNPNGHGHNYTLEVTVGGPVDPATGFCADLPALDRAVHAGVVEHFDHHDLNTLPEFHGLVPTGEVIVQVIWKRLAAAGLPLRAVRLHETRDNVFEYREER